MPTSGGGVRTSVDLANREGEGFCTGNRTWFKLLTVARHYGWQPQGTAAPDWWGTNDWTAGKA